MKNENKFWGRVTKSPYQTPETETIAMELEFQTLYTSGDYGSAGGNPTEDDESVLG